MVVYCTSYNGWGSNQLNTLAQLHHGTDGQHHHINRLYDSGMAPAGHELDGHTCRVAELRALICCDDAADSAVAAASGCAQIAIAMPTSCRLLLLTTSNVISTYSWLTTVVTRLTTEVKLLASYWRGSPSVVGQATGCSRLRAARLRMITCRRVIDAHLPSVTTDGSRRCLCRPTFQSRPVDLASALNQGGCWQALIAAFRWSSSEAVAMTD